MSSVLHVAHFDPPIHGEAVMAMLLRDAAPTWGEEIRYHTVNTVFARSRDQLGGLNPRKLGLLARYLATTVVAKFRNRADILLVHSSFNRGSFLKDSLFIWLGRLLRMKVIAWVHMDPARIDLEHAPVVFRKWVHATLGQVNQFVACAPSLPEAWPEWLKPYPHSGIANAIPDPLRGDAPAPSREHSKGSVRVTYLSAMHRDKGWNDLFLAACRICDHHPGVVFDFHGDVAPDEESALLETFTKSGHPDRIRWHGPAYGKAKTEAFSKSDIFAFPSHTEQFPLSVLEAMAFGLPVVATRVGAVADALQVPEGGALVEARSSRALQDAIEKLLTRPESLAGMGDFNRARFVQEFSLKTFERRWYELLSAK